MLSVFIDGRKLGDGGIGVFIELLISGLLSHEENKSKLHILVTTDFSITRKDLVDKWQGRGLNIHTDDTPKYSLRELFLLPLKWRSLIKSCEYYFSPHYVVPYFIPAKIALVVHDLIHVQYPENFLHRLIAPFLMKSGLKRSKILFTVSEHSRNVLKEHFTFLGSREIHVIPNACKYVSRRSANIEKDEFDADSSSNATSPCKILFVGADREHKRLKLFLEFLSFLKDGSYSFKSTIVSKVTQESLRLTKNLGLNDNVEFVSNITDDQMQELFANTNFFVNTSREEGFCIPLLDAMRCEVPVICPDLAFAQELVSDAAWYFVSGSAQDLLRQFSLAQTLHEERKTRVKAGYEKSLSYTPEAQGAILREVLVS